MVNNISYKEHLEDCTNCIELVGLWLIIFDWLLMKNADHYVWPRQGYSFRKGEFGIRRWLTIVASQASHKRHAESTAMKYKGTPQVSKEDIPITETQGSILSSTACVCKPAWPRSALLKSLLITGPSTMPVGLTMAMASTPVKGHAYDVFIEPLDPYLMAILLKSLQEMGEKDKEQNPTPAGIYSKESVGKVTWWVTWPEVTWWATNRWWHNRSE